MSVAALAPERAAEPVPMPESDRERTVPLPEDSWPHTTRVMPWLIALFAAVLYLIPFDATILPISLPFDSKLDRFVIGAMVLVWLASALVGTTLSAPRRRPSPVDLAAVALLGVVLAGVALNLPELAFGDQLGLVLKKVSLLLTYLLFFYIVSTTVRPGEVGPFITFVLGLATVTAIATIYEYRSGTNLFYQLTGDLPGITVVPPRTGPVNEFSRPAVLGPTGHGLAVCTLLMLAMPFALMRLVNGRDGGERIRNALVTGLLIAGALATQRKSAVIVPLASVLVIAAYRPRQLLRYWPLLIVLVLAIRVLAPGSISGITYQFKTTFSGASESTNDRTSDYAAVTPDVLTHLAVGRGFGSYAPNEYRILDNQLLGMLVETGVLGLVAYLSLAFATIAAVHRVARSRDPVRAGPAIAVVAAAVAFIASNLLYDALGFRHAPYAFLLIAALGVVYATTRWPAADPTLRRRTLAAPPPPDTEREDDGRLAVVVCFLDEEEHLPFLLASLAAQDEPPQELLLVDDGSRDRSLELAQTFADEHAWAHALVRPKRPATSDRLARAAELVAFQWAVPQLARPWDIVLKLDADIELPPNLFAEARRTLAGEPGLGIVGPFLRSRDRSGTLVRESHLATHVKGATKFYRRACWEQISPLPAILGWDTIDDCRARFHGWETRSFALAGGDPVHLRPVGQYDGQARALRRWGACAWGYGAHPLHVLLGALNRARREPYLLGGALYLVGWAEAALRRAPRADPELRVFVRDEEMGQLRRMLRGQPRTTPGPSRSERV